MLLSVVMPVYNERETIEEIIKRVQDVDLKKELIIIDDSSTDGTREYLKSIEGSADNVRVFYHEYNQGKGAALRTGFKEVKGDIVLIQDADLEYFPEEYPDLIDLILRDKADVVYGSRFLGRHRVFLFYHYMGNRFLTFLTNVLYNTMLTDMETCYKAFRAEVLKDIQIKSNRFGVEPELTAKFFKRGLRVYEIPISYAGRTYQEGKKITWRDGLVAIYCLIKYRFFE